MQRFTRLDLHALVWSKPMTEVARQYGLNALRLAKACDTHDIARPPAGYWQKLEHGKRVEMRALESDRFKPEDVVTVPKASILT